MAGRITVKKKGAAKKKGTTKKKAAPKMICCAIGPARIR